MLDRFAGQMMKGGLLGSLLGGKDFSQGVIPGLIDRDMSGGILGTVINSDQYPSLNNIARLPGGEQGPVQGYHTPIKNYGGRYMPEGGQPGGMPPSPMGIPLV